MIIKLRTLTEKSKLGFGRYATKTIEELLHVRAMVYLSWIYYNSSNITFTKEVLDKIGIWEEKRIDKPGKCPELHYDHIGLSINTLRDFKIKAHINKEKRIEKKNFLRSSMNKWTSKSSLAWKNQGH